MCENARTRPGRATRSSDRLRVGRAIEALQYHWYEDPLKESDIYNYVKLRQKLDVPILATELPMGSFADYNILDFERATDFLRGDVAVKGGISTLIKTAHLAEAFSMNYEVYHGGNSLNNVANLHVIMATRNSEFFEVLLPDEAEIRAGRGYRDRPATAWSMRLRGPVSACKSTGS